MNKTNRILLGIALAIGATIAVNLMGTSVLTSLAAADCGCQECVETECGCDACAAPCECKAKPCRCRKPCREKRCRVKNKSCCPSCRVECDTCTLKLDHYEAEKTCFQTEQKIVCIPPVRFPWMKCCPPGKSTTRTVNLLKIHKYKCKACGYKWDVDPLPEPCAAPEQTPVEYGTDAGYPANQEQVAGQQAPSDPSSIDPVVGPVENGILLPPEGRPVPQPAFEGPAPTPVEAGVPGGADVPTPPSPDA